MGVPLAIQLYTLRKEAEEDFTKTLEFVAEQGFTGVEFAGFFDVPAEKMKADLERLGLKVAGSHTSFVGLEEDFDKIIAYNKTIGNKNITVGVGLPKTIEEMNSTISRLKEVAKKVKAAGLDFSYHNHSHEYGKIGEKTFMDHIFDQMSVDEMKKIQAVINASNELQVEWIILENDIPVPNGFDDVKVSMNNLKTKYYL